MNVNRREFLTGATALTVLGWRRLAVAAGYPEYWGDSLARAAARTKALAADCADGFWFITDLHISHNRCRSGQLLAELVRRSPLDRVLCGGDLPVAFSEGFKGDREAVDFAVTKYANEWVKPIRAAGGKVYTAKGNHDFTVCRSYKTPETRKLGFTYDGRKAREIVVGNSTERDVVSNPADPTACYYYFDRPEAGLRYVVVDTSDTERAGDNPWGVVYGIHEPQYKWLAGTALATVPAGYDVVFMHHIPVTGVVSSEGPKRFAKMRELLEAYQNRGVFAVGDAKYDFAAAKGRILLDLTGHEHCDMWTFQKGVLHVTDSSDAYGDAERSKPWSGDLPPKKGGTAAEQTFDAVQFDRRRRLVYFTRVGGGQDRVFHLDALSAKVGATLKFEAKLLKGPLTWGCYDADRVDEKKSPKSRWSTLPAYHNDFATIGPDGALAAKKPGEVVVLAMDAKLNKEIFPVTII